MLGVAGLFTGNGEDLRFEPNANFPVGEQQALSQDVGRDLAWPSGPLTRGAAAIWLAQELGL